MRDKYILLTLVLILASLVLCLLILLGEKTYHYAYIDLNGNLKLACRCRDVRCEDLNGNVTIVKQYVDLRKKN